jgi:histidine triad (HIT) family protein
MSDYNQNNVFAKIIRGEIPCDKIYEDDKVLAFYDMHPQKKVHVLVIPKGAYADMSDFSENASDDEIIALNRAIPKIAALAGLDKNGYRLISNCGPDSHQEVPHLHLHLLGGEPVGLMTDKKIPR